MWLGKWGLNVVAGPGGAYFPPLRVFISLIITCDKSCEIYLCSGVQFSNLLENPVKLKHLVAHDSQYLQTAVK